MGFWGIEKSVSMVTQEQVDGVLKANAKYTKELNDENQIQEEDDG